MKTVQIGCGSAWENDRIEPAAELAHSGKVKYVCFDCLAERTLGLAQQRKLKDPKHGYNPLLERRMEALLPICAEKGVRLIGNWGAANPPGATEVIKEMARKKGIRGLKIATITGDDIFDERLGGLDLTIQETGKKVKDLQGKLVSANAYIGCESIVEALRLGADIVVGGRIADPSLFLAPMVYELQWPLNEWNLLAAGQMIGHIMECGVQCTGGYFADPGYCEVPDLHNLAYPYAEVSENGDAVVTKLEGTGGLVTANTCKAQFVYEILDPANYFTPDVTVDAQNTKLKEVGKDRVLVTGTKGKPRPEMLKVSIGVLEGYIGEGEISYAGPGAYERSKLCLDVIKKRVEIISRKEGGVLESKFDIIGVDSIFGANSPKPKEAPYDLRVRFAVRCQEEKVANLVAEEGWHAFFGPAGSGGNRSYVRQSLAIYTSFVPRDIIQQKVKIEEV